MPRRKRRSKRRVLSPAEQFRAIIDDGLPPNPLTRSGADEAGGEPVHDDVSFDEGDDFVGFDDGDVVGLDELADESRHGAT